MSRKLRLQIYLACGMTLLGAGGIASAQIAAVQGPVPFSEQNPMYAAADAEGANVGANLKTFNYVEEEYFIEGAAAAYEHSARGPKARTGLLPYVTRIIVRRPADPAKFSGVVHFEPVHPTHGWDGHWLVLNQYLMSRGDIYVLAGVGDASKGWAGSPQYKPPASPTGGNRILKWFNPERYSSISWPEEEGIRFQLMADIGKKLRSEDSDNPLKGSPVKAMLMGGWSYTGSIQRTFINEGFHDHMRLPDGRPIFDGYLIGVSSERNDPGYLPLFNDEPFVPLDSPRRLPKSVDAKVIEFLTESEVELAAGPPNSSAKGPGPSGRRTYELAGVIHTDNLYGVGLARKEPPINAQLRAKGYQFATVSTVSSELCDLPASDIPEDAFVRAAVDNLRRWVLDGALPPDSVRLEKDGTGLARDATGNALGGIRAAEFEVPLARYGRYQGDDKPGCKADNFYPSVFLVREELPGDELVRRYGTPNAYFEKYGQQIDRLVKQRWLLEEDALRLKAKTLQRVSNGL